MCHKSPVQVTLLNWVCSKFFIWTFTSQLQLTLLVFLLPNFLYSSLFLFFSFLSSPYLTHSTLPSHSILSLFGSWQSVFRSRTVLTFILPLSPSLPLNVFWMQMLFPMFVRAFHTNYSMVRNRKEWERIGGKELKEGGKQEGNDGWVRSFSKSFVSLCEERRRRKKKERTTLETSSSLLSTLILHSAIFYY